MVHLTIDCQSNPLYKAVGAISEACLVQQFHLKNTINTPGRLVRYTLLRGVHPKHASMDSHYQLWAWVILVVACLRSTSAAHLGANISGHNRPSLGTNIAHKNYSS